MASVLMVSVQSCDDIDSSIKTEYHDTVIAIYLSEKIANDICSRLNDLADHYKINAINRAVFCGEKNWLDFKNEAAPLVSDPHLILGLVCGASYIFYTINRELNEEKDKDLSEVEKLRQNVKDYQENQFKLWYKTLYNKHKSIKNLHFLNDLKIIIGSVR